MRVSLGVSKRRQMLATIVAVVGLPLLTLVLTQTRSHTLKRKHYRERKGKKPLTNTCYCLYRWSAVVRGAVDTECGRNHTRTANFSN